MLILCIRKKNWIAKVFFYESMEQNPFLDNSTRPRSSFENTPQSLPGSILGVSVKACAVILIPITLCIAVPTSELVIGLRFRDPRYCPVETRISLFLIVHGAISLGYVAFLIIITALKICGIARSSSAPSACFIIAIVIEVIILLVSTSCLIVGAVWTFGVNNQVIHHYDTANNFYLYTYCHPALYRFSRYYIIFWYNIVTFHIILRICFACKWFHMINTTIFVADSNSLNRISLWINLFLLTLGAWR